MQVSQRDAGNCRYCRLNQWGQGAAFHVNHVIPRSKGGATELENLVLQCPHCSLHKSNTTAVVDIETGDESALFHPLRQAWSEHFRLEDDGSCVGLTPTGRVTVMALRMNDPIPHRARALQLALRLIEGDIG
jgi:hypothetical protein